MEMTFRALFTLGMTGLLVACGGSGSGGGGGPPHSVGGTISGLTGSGLVLLDNGTDSLPVSASGTFTFATQVAGGSAYDVTVRTEPANPSQTCVVAHGSGTISGSDITNVTVMCAINTYTIGGTITGLQGSALVLGLNGTQNAAKAGAFTLAPAIASGSTYTVSVVTQPTGPPQTCTVANASGKVTSVNITNVAVSCTTNTYIVGAYVAGLAGSGLALSYNGAAGQTLSRNGYSSLANGIAIGTSYAVTIASQPTNPAQTCTLANGSGAVGTANVTSIFVYCPQAVGQFAYLATAGFIPQDDPDPGAISTPGSLSAYSIDPSSGALSLVAGSVISTGPNVTVLQLVPHSSFLWAFSLGGGDQVENADADSSVYSYTVNPASGLLTANAGNPFYTLSGNGSTPANKACPFESTGYGYTLDITLAPSGAFGYAFNSSDMGAPNEDAWVFTVSSSGAPTGLTAASGVNCIISPVSVDPSGQFAYYAVEATSNTGHDVVASTIDQATGVLTTVPGTSPLTIGVGGQSAADFDPFGRFIYYLDGDLIYGFTIDPVSGALSAITGSPFSFPSGSLSMQFSPDGQFAYVTDGAGLYTYSIAPTTGVLSAVGAPISLKYPAQPSNFTLTELDPSGEFLYTSAADGSGQTGVYAYSRNPGTGALTAVPGSPFAVTSQSSSLSLTVIN